MSVAVVISTKEEVKTLIYWAVRFSRISSSQIHVYHAEQGAEAELGFHEDSPEPEHELLALILAELKSHNLSKTQDDDQKHVFEVFNIVSAEPDEAVLEKLSARAPDLLLLGNDAKRPKQDPINLFVQNIFEETTSKVLLVRIDEQEAPAQMKKILLPTSGGPHAKSALQMANDLASSDEGVVTVFFVEPIMGEGSEQVGQRILDRILQKNGFSDAENFESKIAISNDIRRAIADEVAKGYDLVLLGASSIGAIRRALFGTIPERIIASDTGTAIAVIRSATPLLDKAQRTIEDILDLTVPKLERDERIALVEDLQLKSQWNFDFLVLITLSTAIAGMGLLQNSAAVVIGAMLVAPLMTPLLGAGLAIVQGNYPLLSNASRAIFYGFFSALGVAIIIGQFYPITAPTAELLARGGPRFLDLFVALFSGFAAAYCVGRPGLSAALPGVAIAAALVPPIACTGISLSQGHLDLAQGSAVLFTLNVVTIIVGSAFSFYGGGIRSNGTQGTWSKLVRASLLVSSIMVICYLAISGGRSNMSRSVEIALQSLVTQEVETLKDTSVSDVKLVPQTTGPAKLLVYMQTPVLPSSSLANRIQELAETYLSEEVIVSIRPQLEILSEDKPQETNDK
jgi:uncharacterized hydrophobic protein (TIGR00271 family)